MDWTLLTTTLDPLSRSLRHRVHASGQGHHRWVSRHGVHWFLRQAHPHSNQQHPDGVSYGGRRVAFMFFSGTTQVMFPVFLLSCA